MNMKNLLTCLLAALGLTTACGQKNYEDVDTEGFAALIAQPEVVVLDVRTSEEYLEGHLAEALLIDVKGDDFLDKARKALPKDKTIAIYCRSGRRSAHAAEMLAAEGFKVVNLKGGILAWQAEQRPVVQE
jgi:rhodanese-related sulfurtransferase